MLKAVLFFPSVRRFYQTFLLSHSLEKVRKFHPSSEPGGCLILGLPSLFPSRLGSFFPERGIQPPFSLWTRQKGNFESVFSSLSSLFLLCFIVFWLLQLQFLELQQKLKGRFRWWNRTLQKSELLKINIEKGSFIGQRPKAGMVKDMAILEETDGLASYKRPKSGHFHPLEFTASSLSGPRPFWQWKGAFGEPSGRPCRPCRACLQRKGLSFSS